MNYRGQLCFHAPNLYPVAAGGKTEFVGGIEVQDWTLARGLAERGFEVSIATCDFGQHYPESYEGVELLPTYSKEAGIRGIRFFYPRLWKTIGTLRQAEADVYLANGAGLPAGWAYDVARSLGSRFVFLVASDKDVQLSLPALRRRRERWWYLRALHGADARIAQTEYQRYLLRKNFALDSHVIANPVELPTTLPDASANQVVLWLSTYKSTKRPEWFVELARRLPSLRFVMVGFAQSMEANENWLAAKRAEAELPNLAVHGFIDHARIGDFFQSAALFVHTSPLEGFPNTLLEAWSYGIPSVTTVDPDGVVEQYEMGYAATTFSELQEAVSAIMADPVRRRESGARARRYVEDHHGADSTISALAALLDQITQNLPREAV